jgi:transcriptional regulator with XRE-family HTH domain
MVTMTRQEHPILCAIRETREERGITQEALGTAIGRAQNSISKLERGAEKEPPTVDEVAAIEVALGVPKGYILRKAGYVVPMTTVEDLIMSDPGLSPPNRQAVLAVYSSLRENRTRKPRK